MNRVIQFIRHYWSAKSRHGVHSPFVYKLIDECLYRDARIDCNISTYYENLKRNTSVISGMDYGRNKEIEVSMAHLAKRSATKGFEVELLVRLFSYPKYKRILELGSNIGKATCAIAATNPQAEIHSIEGNESIAEFARNALNYLEIKNATVHCSTFDDFFGRNQGEFDAVFIDGDHRYDPTMKNYRNAKQVLFGAGPIVLHDIYWSREMNRAWKDIQDDPKATVTIDLFFFGLVYFRPDQAKEHFNIRYPRNLLRLLF